MKPICSTVLFIFLFFSCHSAGNLTREKAEELIKIKLHNVAGYSLKIKDSRLDPDYAPVKKLLVNGYLSFIGTKLNQYGMYANNFNITKLGENFIVTGKDLETLPEKGESSEKTIIVKSHEVYLGEITGIIENQESKSAFVEFTTLNKNKTPFGEYFEEEYRRNIPEQNKRKATFTLFDDGWRLTEIKCLDDCTHPLDPN